MSQTLRSSGLGPRVEVQMVSSGSQSKGILFADIVQGCAVLASLEDRSSVRVHLGVICRADGCTCGGVRRIRDVIGFDIPSSKSCPKLSASSGLVKNFPSSYYSKLSLYSVVSAGTTHQTRPSIRILFVAWPLNSRTSRQLGIRHSSIITRSTLGGPRPVIESFFLGLER